MTTNRLSWNGNGHSPNGNGSHNGNGNHPSTVSAERDTSLPAPGSPAIAIASGQIQEELLARANLVQWAAHMQQEVFELQIERLSEPIIARQLAYHCGWCIRYLLEEHGTLTDRQFERIVADVY